MITPVLAFSPYVLYPVTAMFVFVCLLLVCVVLIQKPKGGGLSGAFGGGASSAQSAFGARTGDLLTWFTVGAFAVFLILGVILTLISRPERITAGSSPKAAFSESPLPTTLPAAAAPGTATGAATTSSSTTQPSNGENKR